MKITAQNFDLGVKNYKKNRLIVDHTHLKNEILYNIERTQKRIVSISVISYVNNPLQPRKYMEVLKDLDVDGLTNSFNFFINNKGNVFTNVEISDPTYFNEVEDNVLNVVVCLNGTLKKDDNSSTATKIYKPTQLKSLTRLLGVFYDTFVETKYREIEVTKEIEKLSSSGFKLETYTKERGLHG